jgi:hypothetical protein
MKLGAGMLAINHCFTHRYLIYTRWRISFSKIEAKNIPAAFEYSAVPCWCFPLAKKTTITFII